MKNTIVAKSSEEFIWATVSGSAPLRREPVFEYQVALFHGRCNDRNWVCRIKPGLMISFMDVTPKRDISNRVAAREDWLRFVFFLSGRGSVDYQFIDRRLTRDFYDGIVRHSYLTFSPEISGQVNIRAEHRLRIFSIHISPARLSAYFGGRFNMGPHSLRDIVAGYDRASFFHTARMTDRMEASVNQVLSCPFSGALRQVFLEGKAMELITFKLHQLIRPTPGAGMLPEPDGDGYARIKQAAQILTRDLEAPPGLFDLARQVGIGHTGLNAGFKQVYGTTVFGFLRHARLEKAGELLVSGRMNVTQAAYEVGYSSLPSFSKAFSAYFGMSPAAYQKRFRYSG